MPSIAELLRLILYPVAVQRIIRDTNSPFYHAFPDLGGRAVVRENFLIDRCAGKRVLHFGFLDAPFTTDRYHTSELLHSRLKQVAHSVFGADISAEALDEYRELSGDRDNMILDVQAPMHPGEFSNRFDIVIFGEILEHLTNPGAALANLRAISLANDGCEVCITTPNAFFVGGFVPAIRSREIVHPDHYYYFSPATLLRLLTDTGFGRVQLKFYSSRETLAAPGLTKAGLIACCRP